MINLICSSSIFFSQSSEGGFQYTCCAPVPVVGWKRSRSLFVTYDTSSRKSNSFLLESKHLYYVHPGSDLASLVIALLFEKHGVNSFFRALPRANVTAFHKILRTSSVSKKYGYVSRIF